MKLIRWVLLTFVMLAFALSSTAGLDGKRMHGVTDGQEWHRTLVRAATPNPPHGVTITVTHGACRMRYQHGNFGGGYAQAQTVSGSRCLYPPNVKVIGFNGQRWDSAVCASQSCFGNGWYQAYVPGYSLVGGELILCVGSATLQDCKKFLFAGV